MNSKLSLLSYGSFSPIPLQFFDLSCILTLLAALLSLPLSHPADSACAIIYNKLVTLDSSLPFSIKAYFNSEQFLLIRFSSCSQGSGSQSAIKSLNFLYPPQPSTTLAYSFISLLAFFFFPSSSPVWVPFIYFACLTTLTRTSSTILNTWGESRYPCFVPDLRRKAFTVTLLCKQDVSCGFS